MRSKIMGVVLLCYLIWVAFVGDDLELACIWTKCDVGFKTMLLLLHLNLVCNNYVELQCMWTICELDVTCDLYVESCMILACMLVDSRSLVMLVVLPGLYGLKYDGWPLQWLLLYLCSYKLDSSVTAGVRARFNIKLVICVFKTKVFVSQNQFWQLIVIHQYVQIHNLNLECVSGHILYA
jgi:hypothetical protein